jgi:methionyl aminopeptidase
VRGSVRPFSTTQERWRTTPVALKLPEEIDAIASACAAARRVLDRVCALCEPGVATRDLDAAAQATIDELDAVALFRNYRQASAPPFPGCICVSINDEAVHGIPGERTLDQGDCVSIDIGLKVGEWCADTARTVLVGPLGPDESIAPEMRARCDAIARLIATTRGLLVEAASMMHPGARWSTIATHLEVRAAEAGYGVVGEYVGHGIGRFLHEAPQAPCYWSSYTGVDFVLAAGMVIAVEPMLTLDAASLGTTQPSRRAGELTPITLRPDGWTVRTLDASLVCHEEAVVAVTTEGPRVLTGPILP